MQTNRFVEQEDHDMQWLAREAPQFHTNMDVPRVPPSFSAKHIRDDVSSTSSDNDSAGSDSDDDPYHPYNVQDTSKRWVREGDFVYPADDLQDSYLAESTHAVDDVPYLPPSDQAKEDMSSGLFLAPDDITPLNPFTPYVYRDAAPQQQPQTLSPLELSPLLPASPLAVPESDDSSRIQHTPASSRRGGVRPARERTNAFSLDSDDDAYASSGDDASEDEYVPSPRIRSRKLRSSTHTRSQGRTKHHRATSRHSYSPYPSSSTSTSAAESSSAANSRRPGSRNVQIIDQAPPPRGSWAKTGPDAYKCPYCDHVQKNKRSPDMERHIRSHFRRTAQSQWVCCGLPLEEAMRRGRGQGDNPWIFNGELMVGGCHEDFSRMDALKRHWRNSNNSCIGDIRYARVKDEPSQ
ncbi:hypothetical protein C8Q77DRAFT_1074211 [Trametes polyzona]|nr:hypothetical protein C8Q77DRAFT_1074211 [Trametes polyzona]